MSLSDIFFFILYGLAFILLIYFFIGILYKPTPSTVVVYDETPVYYDPTWWPWGAGTYNWWPYWGGWWSGGGNGGYGYYGRRLGPHHHRLAGGWGGRPYGGAGRGSNLGGFSRGGRVR
jgi:hypothetical protein